MTPSDSSDDIAAKFKKELNRIAVPLQQLETSDTTLRQAHLRQSVANNGALLHTLKKFNQALVVLIAIAGFYFLLEASFLGRRGLKLPEEKPVVTTEEASLPVIAYAQWTELSQLMERRSIFEPFASAAQKNVLQEQILQQIRIVGVMLDGANPQAIIEVISSGSTVFVSKGDEVAGAVVQEIFENKVVLTYNGLELELLR